MTFDKRRLAVALAGFSAFLNLYSPQAVLPELSRQFGASPAKASMIMYAGTFAVALTAPITGALADVLGRKRVITFAMFAVCVPMVLVALAPDVPSIALWRFVQGLLLPPIFTVTIAYIGDEWRPAQVAGVVGIYVTGSSIGGFSGRMVPSALVDVVGWRIAFVVLAAITFAAAITVALTLSRETKFVRSEGLRASLVQLVRHLGNRQLLATYAIGFGTLFNFVATFTYVNFLLAAPPYNFPNALLGAIFVTYLVGAAIAPMTGRVIGRFGRRRVMLGVIALWMLGVAITLSPPVGLIIFGLALCAACGLVCQTISTGYVTMMAEEGRSSAAGLYATFFYIGGSAGAFFPGLTWAHAGWPAAVGMMLLVQAGMAMIVALAWSRER